VRRAHLSRRSKLGKVGAVWRAKGPVGSLGSLRWFLFSRERLLRLRLDLEDFRPLSGAPPELTARRADLSELERFRAANPRLPQSFFADRLHGTEHVYLGLWAGQVAHVHWAMAPQHDAPLIPLREGEVELMYGYTLAPFRRRGLDTHVVNRMLVDLQATSATRHVYTHVALRNAASLRVFAKLGFRPVARVERRHIFGFQRVRCHPLAGEAHP
jgi:RimJ/RimL family protein N-acetyltransferase